jgi:hypothetical protein
MGGRRLCPMLGKRDGAKFLMFSNLPAKIAARRAAGNVVLVSRPIKEGMAISCQVKEWGTIELRFYVRSDDTIFLLDKLAEEVIVGVLDDDGVQDKIARAIGSKLPERTAIGLEHE